MILKIQIYNGWSYFDNIDRVEVYEVERSLKDDSSCPTHCMFETFGEKATKLIKVIMLFTKGVMTDRIKVDLNSVYLMSNEGKTIERIN